MAEITAKDIRQAFDEIDVSKAGFIDYDRLSAFLSGLGETVDEEELVEMIGILDKDGDGKISLADFSKEMTGPPDSELLVETKRLLGDHADTASKSEFTLFLEKLASDNPSDGMSSRLAKYHDDLSYGEFCTLLDHPGTESSMAKAFHLFDANGDGRLSPIEIMIALNSFSSASKQDKIVYGFRLCDGNKDNFVNKQELGLIIRANFLSKDHIRQKVEGALQIGGSESGQLALEQLLHVASLNLGLIYPVWKFFRSTSQTQGIVRCRKP
jgi:Ca2+-binding EF-hand superfamily protein